MVDYSGFAKRLRAAPERLKAVAGRRAVVVSVLIAAVAAAGWVAVATSQGSARQDGAANAATDRSAVAALARIEPASRTINVAAPIVDRLEKLNVVEGDVVRAGQILGYLNSYDERRADRDQIALKLAEAERRLQSEMAAGNSRIETAEIKLRRADAVYPLRIDAQQAKIRSLEAELANARDILKSRSKLKRENFSSRRSVDDQRTQVRRNEEDLLTARVELKRLQAEFELDRSDARNESVQAKADMDRAIETIGVDALRGQLALTEQSVERAVIRAPIAGQILKIMIRPGESADRGPVLKMGDTSVMHAVAEVYETDIRHVKVGQTARITSPALGKPLTGRVVQVGNIIFKNDVLNVDPAADTDARIVEVRIELEPDPLVARLTNLTADAVIDVSADAATAEKK